MIKKIVNILLFLIALGLISMVGYRLLVPQEIVSVEVTNREKQKVEGEELKEQGSNSESEKITSEQEAKKEESGAVGPQTQEVAPASEVKNSAANSKEDIKSIVKEYLLANPKDILTSIEQLQQEKIQKAEAKVKEYFDEQKAEIEDSKSSPIMGNIKGDITIVAFFDYNCSYCRKGNVYLNELLKEDAGVGVILKQFPILGESSNETARAAIAVHKLFPDKFLAFHEALMGMNHFSTAEVHEVLQKNQIDVAQIITNSKSAEVNSVLIKNYELANNLRIKGVPTYIINGKILPGLIDLERLKSIIREIRSSSEAK